MSKSSFYFTGVTFDKKGNVIMDDGELHVTRIRGKNGEADGEIIGGNKERHEAAVERGIKIKEKVDRLLKKNGKLDGQRILDILREANES